MVEIVIVRKFLTSAACVLACTAFLLGCAKREDQSAGGKVEISFWHTQSDENGRVLNEIVDEFNRTHGNIHVTATYVSGYTDIFKKLKAAVIARDLPDLAVAYESMVAEYMKSGVIEPFDAYVSDPEIGLTEESLQDFFPVFIESNRFEQFDDQLLSFPFTKSLLVMYYNADMLKAAGFEAPPQTWAQFIEQCRAVKDKLGKPGYALSVDASTVHGMIMSFGGRVLDEKTMKTGYGSPAAIAALRTIRTLVSEGLTYMIKYDSYDDRVDLASERCAFMIRSTTSRPYLAEMIQDKFRWDLAIPPHGEGQPPITVLFGANICMFKSTPARQRAAWEFVRYFCSRDVTALWATKTGYMPVRKSATETERMKALFAEMPQNRRFLEIVPFSRREPGVAGIQAVRPFVEKAENHMIFGTKTPEEAAQELAQSAAKILQPR